MNITIYHFDKPHQPLQLAFDFHDNPSRQGCVAVHEDSLYRSPTMHLAFHMDTTYNRPAPPDEQGQMDRNHAVDDFNYTKIVFSSTMIRIKPIIVEERCF
jgi:hypothetical protein